MNDVQVAKGLGIFSLGLGLTEIIAPRWLGEVSGVGPRTKTLRAFGAREIGAGIGVLSQKEPKRALRARFAGDLIDLAFLAGALKWSARRSRVALSIAAVLGVTLLDAIYARRF